MAMEIDPFSMLEVSLQEGPEDDPVDAKPTFDARGQIIKVRTHNSSSGVRHQVENDLQVVQPPPPLSFFGTDAPHRAVLNNIQKLSSTSKEEEKFRRRAYSSISLVLRKRLHCTICDAHIGAYLGLKEMDIEHPLLKVLACSKCTLKYHYLEFPLNPDGRDIRCRWCTNSSKEESPLRFCNYCPFAFCEMCIYRNLPLDELASNKNDWICFVCNVKDLWPSRAVLWALRVLIDTNLALKEEKKWSTDQSTCCKSKVIKQQRRQHMTMTPNVMQTNGHNLVAPMRPSGPSVRPIRMGIPNANNYRMPYNRIPNSNSVRPIQLSSQTAGTYQRTVRPPISLQPRPMITSGSSNNANTQLYDTAWLTDKVSNISTTILNLNNNLHRLAQGIPEKENKYSIKSKMISMVSLLNISATQLQKASKEMEEESKKILDKNYRVARINPTMTESKEPKPSLTVISPSPSTSSYSDHRSKRPLPKNRHLSNKKIKRRRGSSSESFTEDDDDPDFVTSAMKEESSGYELRTRRCFVKLERLNDRLVDTLSLTRDPTNFEPQPSTSTAPDPLGTVRPEELPSEESDEDKFKGERYERADNPSSEAVIGSAIGNVPFVNDAKTEDVSESRKAIVEPLDEVSERRENCVPVTTESSEAAVVEPNNEVLQSSEAVAELNNEVLGSSKAVVEPNNDVSESSEINLPANEVSESRETASNPDEAATEFEDKVSEVATESEDVSEPDAALAESNSTDLHSALSVDNSEGSKTSNSNREETSVAQKTFDDPTNRQSPIDDWEPRNSDIFPNDVIKTCDELRDSSNSTPSLSESAPGDK